MDGYMLGRTSAEGEVFVSIWHGVAWRLVKLVIPLALLVGITALIVTRNLPWQTPYPGPFSNQFSSNTLIADFGLQRVNLTRSILVSSGATAVSTPAILTARLSTDLIESPKLEQFPADQITLTATPVGPKQIEIVAILNPVNPDRVADGLFAGTISVYTGANTLSVPIAVYLAPKSGYRALLAFLLLLLGAIFGLSIKWVTEALSSLAAARWRFSAILQALGGPTRQLPTSIEDQVTIIGDRIRRQDLDELDKSFESLESARVLLREFSDNITDINDEIGRQAGMGKKVASLRVAAVIRAEQQHVRDLRIRPWPQQDVQTTLDGVKRLRVHVKTATRAIEERRNDVLELYAADQFEEGYECYRTKDSTASSERAGAGQPGHPAGQSEEAFQAPEPDVFVLRRGANRWRPLSDGAGIIQWMTERPRSLAAAASILVVAIVGLQLQYLNSTSFDGSLAEWLSLVLWAAVIELSGVSVLDVVGRLSGSGSAPRSTRV